MKILKDIEELKTAAAELRAVGAELAKAIATAPVPRTYTVSLPDKALEISERDALAFICAVVVGLRGEASAMRQADGSTFEVDAGDIEIIAGQIARQVAAADGC